MAIPNPAYPTNHPLHHTARIGGLLNELIAHLRSDIDQFDEPKAQALFETTAQVLLGLRTAFRDYEEQSTKGLQEKFEKRP